MEYFLIALNLIMFYIPVFESNNVKKVQQTAWLSHCCTFSSFGSQPTSFIKYAIFSIGDEV